MTVGDNSTCPIKGEVEEYPVSTSISTAG